MSKIVFETDIKNFSEANIEAALASLRKTLDSARENELAKAKEEERKKELEAEVSTLRGNLATAIAEYISAIEEKVTGERMSTEDCDRLHVQLYNYLKSMEDIEFGIMRTGINFKPISFDFTDLIEKPKNSQEKPNVSRTAKMDSKIEDDEVLKRFIEIFGK